MEPVTTAFLSRIEIDESLFALAPGNNASRLSLDDNPIIYATGMYPWCFTPGFFDLEAKNRIPTVWVFTWAYCGMRFRYILTYLPESSLPANSNTMRLTRENCGFCNDKISGCFAKSRIFLETPRFWQPFIL